DGRRCPTFQKRSLRRSMKSGPAGTAATGRPQQPRSAKGLTGTTRFVRSVGNITKLPRSFARSMACPILLHRALTRRLGGALGMGPLQLSY
ncbi:hypothetical protein EV182_003328, partial [Spiromyces aspiralis]